MSTLILMLVLIQKIHENHTNQAKSHLFWHYFPLFKNSRHVSRLSSAALITLINSTSARPFYAFDEWATDPQPEFVELIYIKLLPALKAKGKTVLIITHDDCHFHLADRCIKLEEDIFVDFEYSTLNTQQDHR